MNNIVNFTGGTIGRIEPDVVLEKAVGILDEVLVLGTDKDGNYYFASSTSNKGDLLLLIEQFKHQIIFGDIND